MSVRVSVIIPSKDPGACIKKCIGSLKKQTLKDIEIICVDACSSDGTAEYLAGVCEQDPRFSCISCPDASYGSLVNEGLDRAQGRFISIIRPGDTAEPEMLRELYSVSSGMDLVMGGLFLTPAKGESEELYKLPARYTAIKSFNPLLTFDTALDQSEIFSINCAAGSAIISREFLINNSIYFTDVKDSPYHDISFSFKVWACASNVRLLDSAFLHCGYRGNFSSNAGVSTVISVFDEFEEIGYFIRDVFAKVPKRIRVLFGIMTRLEYDQCINCCKGLPENLSRQFARRSAAEFEPLAEKGLAQNKYFPAFDWNIFSTWVYDPEKFIDILNRSKKPSLISRIMKAFMK